MKIYLDSSLPEIEQLIKKFDLDGATCNPSILLREKTRLSDFVKQVPKGKKVFAQLTETEVDKMIAQAQEMVAKYPGIIVKIPATKAGFEVMVACHKLGIKTLATAIYSLQQGLFAAYCKASYLALYIKRINQLGVDGIAVAKDLLRALDAHGFDCEIVGASFSDVRQINLLFEAGIESVTLPLDLFDLWISDQHVDKAVVKFTQDAEKLKQLFE